MIVAFETKRLRIVCEDTQQASAQYGNRVASQLRGRIADIRSAASVFDLPTGNPRIIADQFFIDLGGLATMHWVPNGTSAVPGEDGSIDWERVNRIRLISIDKE